ncbi:hypothetical protein DAEQUDRAFT_726486 [Daedalea quercina L-15889]|uniref:Uncharacterized protein n=1 Tax=Daedalea quercina L-15889 TaxID=1314783 RepID=A0A165QIR6_9APHY|nr:hypothetical protein DAEQUDRAFT_726486 [Daedalea quercina L-15889]
MVYHVVAAIRCSPSAVDDGQEIAMGKMKQLLLSNPCAGTSVNCTSCHSFACAYAS